MSGVPGPDILPERLRERARTVGRPRSGGELVLYWMHHAVRADENPALDAANHVAQALELPLLVYQGLGANHEYDSDRHHTFIMEGARDASRTLAERGIRHVFRLGRRRDEASPLRALAARAAVVVTEDFPVPPFPRWSRDLAGRTGTPVWLVDTACVVPMQRVAKAHERAFAFRRAIESELEKRLTAGWPEAGPPAAQFTGALGFEPVDWARSPIADLCAACEIDHAVGPVPGTVGGAADGLARWEAFKAVGLGSYDRLRNDAAVAPPRGVSRLSPYLHHGHVSPMRIAREAAAQSGSGPRKFIDELIVWRELAHNYCFHRAERLESTAWLDLLPQWSRDTLSEHARDPRDRVYSWERLARARTGDSLWDLAQRSLQVHGELHNNVRMTWGKALVGWTAGPERALELLFDLNHRYALDGSDPNSFGGLLYSLGLFDRPFEPAQPVSGTVRTRSTAAHARRLDLARFEERAARRSGAGSIAVIGAGIAGLAAARTLLDQGFRVTVLERSRSVGGRAATRRGEHGSFDHGAQYFTVTDPRFAKYVRAWEEEGRVARWNARVVRLGAGGRVGEPDAAIRYVGVPGMRAVAAHLGTDVEVRTEVSVVGATREHGRWHLKAASGDQIGGFDALLVATAPEQAAPLVEHAPALRRQVEAVASVPCCAAMVRFDAPLATAFDAAFVDDPCLAWIARDSSKPGRDAGERWVLHAMPEWSASRTEQDPAEVAEEMLQAFERAIRVPLTGVAQLTGHRWRLARVPTGLGAECVWDGSVRAGLCGDWCLSSRLESAFLSGVAAAGRVSGELRDGEAEQGDLFADAK